MDQLDTLGNSALSGGGFSFLELFLQAHLVVQL